MLYSKKGHGYIKKLCLGVLLFVGVGVIYTASAAEAQSLEIVLSPAPSDGAEESVLFTYTGDGELDMNGWTVSDTLSSQLVRYTFGASTVLTSGDSFQLCGVAGCDGLIQSGGNAVWNNTGDTLVLRDDDGEIVAELLYESTVADQQFTQVFGVSEYVETVPPVAVCAPQFNVSDPASVVNVNTGENFASLTDALSDCDTSDGDTLRLVEDSSAEATININRPITIDGSENTITAQFTAVAAGEPLLAITSPAVSVENLTLLGQDASQHDGIKVSGAVDVEVNTVTIEQFQRGLVLEAAEVSVTTIATKGNQLNSIALLDVDSQLRIAGANQHQDGFFVPHIYMDIIIDEDVSLVEDVDDQYDVWTYSHATIPDRQAASFYLKTLNAPADTDTEAPVVQINFPTTGQMLTEGAYKASGTVSDDTEISTVSYRVEVLAAGEGSAVVSEVVSVEEVVGGDTHSWEFPFEPTESGMYKITVIATDTAGNEGHNTAHVEVGATQTCAIPSAANRTIVVESGNPAVEAWQPESWTAEISGADWLWETTYVTELGVESEVVLEEVFTVTDVRGATLEIAADDFYEVYLNETLVAEGSGYKEVDAHDISTAMREGENVLRVTVRNGAGVRGERVFNEFENPAGVLYQLTVVTEPNAQCVVQALEEVQESDDVQSISGSATRVGERSGGSSEPDDVEEVVSQIDPTPLVLGVATSVSPVPRVLGVSTTTASVPTKTYCPFLSENLRIDLDNDRFEVYKLQLFLRTVMGYDQPITGTFGSVTDANVRIFQEQYREDILTPWVTAGLSTTDESTGYVYVTTRWKINSMVCGERPFPSLAE